MKVYPNFSGAMFRAEGPVYQFGRKGSPSSATARERSSRLPIPPSSPIALRPLRNLSAFHPRRSLPSRDPRGSALPSCPSTEPAHRSPRPPNLPAFHPRRSLPSPDREGAVFQVPFHRAGPIALRALRNLPAFHPRSIDPFLAQNPRRREPVASV